MGRVGEGLSSGGLCTGTEGGAVPPPRYSRAKMAPISQKQKVGLSFNLRYIADISHPEIFNFVYLKRKQTATAFQLLWQACVEYALVHGK